MTFRERDKELFNLIWTEQITELVCIKEGYTDPQKGDSFRKGGEKHTLGKTYKVFNKFAVCIETNFSYTIDIINGSGVSIFFETISEYNRMKRDEKLDKLGI